MSGKIHESENVLITSLGMSYWTHNIYCNPSEGLIYTREWHKRNIMLVALCSLLAIGTGLTVGFHIVLHSWPPEAM